MAASSSKREVSPSQSGSTDGPTTRKKKAKIEEEEDPVDSEDENSESDGQSGKTRKAKGAAAKQKAKKGSDSHPHKCEFPGCQRRYTRAEHLHRHQLEHTRNPKFYKCDRPGCDFGCVRKDLLDRHIERHGKEGSNLWRRDHKSQNGKKQPRISAATARPSKNDEQSIPPKLADPNSNGQLHMNGNGHATSLAQPPSISPSLANEFGVMASEGSPMSPAGAFQQQQPMGQTASVLNGFASPTGMNVAPMSGAFYPLPGQPNPGAAVNTQPFYPDMRPRNTSNNALPTFDQNGLGDPMQDDMASLGPVPVMPQQDNLFSNTLNPFPQQPTQFPSEFDFPDQDFNSDFLTLFQEPQTFQFGYIAPRSGHQEPDRERRYAQTYNDMISVMEDQSRLGHDGSSDASGDIPMISPSRSSTPVHKALSHNTLTKQRQADMLRYIEDKFDDVAKPAKMENRPGETSIFNGVHFENGKLSRETAKRLAVKPLERYYDAFWRDYSPQIPIVHPSLDPNDEETPLLLLLAMIAIGAASLSDGPSPPEKSAECEVAAFIAWNVRTLVQNHGDLICPTETWVLQTLVLLEAFEKLFSSRLLHERSHQLHGLTVELVRRSECFEGGNTIEINENDLYGSWKMFIEKESLKRAAYTVFTTDAFHACMFAHKAMIKFQEVELALPCSDNLWECRDPGSFFKAFQSLDSTKSLNTRIRELPTFQDVLQRLLKSNKSQDFDRVLNNTELQHNRFAFKALLAGFISVHREVDRLTSRSNCQAAFRNLERWVKRSKASSTQQAEEFTELYAISALAQINTRSNVVYLQQIACPRRILGKKVTDTRRNAAFKQVRRWVRNEFYPNSTHQASGAVCCAARFLTHVFAGDRDRDGKVVEVNVNNYQPQFDCFLHRPWAVYISMLCIWAYSYTLEGPLRPEWIVTYSGPDDSRAYMAANIFLDRLSRIETPDQLRDVHELNRCLGILTIMASRFKRCQWELLREAGDRAVDAGNILRRDAAPVPTHGWRWQSVRQPTEEERADSRRETKENFEHLQKQLDESRRQAPALQKRLEAMQRAMKASSSSPAVRPEERG